MPRILIIALFVAAILVELGFLPLLGSPWRFIMLTPLFLIVLVTHGWGRELWFMALAGGLFFDAFSPYPPATFTILFFGIVLFTRLVFYRWFTNRSPLSLLVISTIGIAVFYGALACIRLLTQLIKPESSSALSLADAVKIIGMGTGMSVGILFVWLVVEVYALKLLGRYRMSPRRYHY